MSKYGKIFIIFGRSGSGKDAIYKRLLNELDFLVPVVQYTTRPMRDGEIDGKEYIFVSDEKFDKLDSENKITDSRIYNTKGNDGDRKWKYGNNIEYFCKEAMYLMISTPEGIMQMKNYHDKEFVNSIFPIFINVDEKTLLERTINRESKLSDPNYVEVCDRFIRDSQQFKLDKVYSILNEFEFRIRGGSELVENQDLDTCVNKIKESILGTFLDHPEKYKNIYRLDDILSFINIKGISSQSTVDKLLDLYDSLDRLYRGTSIEGLHNIKRGDILVISLKQDSELSSIGNSFRLYKIIYVDFIDKTNKLIYPYNERGTRYSFDTISRDCIGVCRKTVCNKPLYEGIILY